MKVVKWLALSLVVLLGLIAAALTTVIGTESGRLWLVDKGLSFAEQAGIAVELEGLRTPKLGRWQVALLQIGGDEPLLRIEQLELRWQPGELFQKHLHILNLSAARVQYYQQEADAEPEVAEDAGEIPQLPSSPVAIDIDHLQVEELTLHGLTLPASQSLPSYQISGSASAFTAAAPLALNLEVQSLRDAQNVLRVQTQVIHDKAVRIQGEFYESPQGLVGTLAQLPEQQAIDLEFELVVRQQPDHIELAVGRLQLPFLQHEFAAKGTLQYKPEQRTLRINQLILHSDEQRHRLEGSIDPEDLWLDARFQRFPLEIASPWLTDLQSGTFSGQIQLDWAYGSGQQLPNVRTESDIELTYRQQHIAAQIAGELKGQMVTFAPSRVELQQASLELDGQVDLEGAESDLDVQLHNFSSELLQPWDVPLPPSLQVSADSLKLHLSGAIDDPVVEVQTEIAGRYQQQPFSLDLAGSGSKQQVRLQTLDLVVESGEVNARGILDWTGSDTNLEVELDNIKHTLLELAPPEMREQYPEELTFTANGQVQVQGPLQKPRIKTDARVSGEYAFPEQVLPYKINAVAAGQIGGPAELNIDIEQLTLTLAGQPTIDVSGHYQQQSMDIRVQLNRMPTQVLAALGIDTRGGEAVADLKLRGDIDNPQLQGFVELRSAGEQNKGPAAPPYSLRAQFSSAEQQLLTQIGFTYSGEKVGDLQIRFPLADYLQAQGPWQNIPLAVQAQGTMDLNVSALFLEPNEHQLQGQLRTDITLQGTAEQPDLHGKITLNNGYYYNAAQNISLRDIEVLLEGTGETITLRKANARGIEGGSMALDGRIHWQQQRRTIADAIELNLRANNFVVMQTEEVYAELSGNASLTGSFDELWLRGKFDVSPLRASIDAAITTPIPTIEVSEVGEDDDEQEQDVPTPMPRINLDLVIAAGQQAYLSGRGLATELGGRITVSGTAEDPQFVGRFTTLRGRLDIFGRRFVLGDGEVRFSNDAASLRIPAVYKGDDIEVRALIAGTADDPKLTLSSVPDLPQDELMARLIFGKGVEGLNTAEAIRLAGALNTLRSGGGGIVDTARQKLGVDTLTIENEETERGSGLTMGVGKYVNEKVYIELKNSRNTAQPWQGNVEVEINSRLNLEGGTNEDGGANARLMWKKDY